MSFDLNNTIGGRLLLKLEKEIKECIIIPNSWLPEKYHDKVRGGRTLARLETICDKRVGITNHRKTKAIKAENIENYRKQFEQNGKFEYNGHINELQLYKNEMALCAAHPAIKIEEDDLHE